MNNINKPPNIEKQKAVSFLEKPNKILQGLGDKSSIGLDRIGLFTVKDIVFSFPYRYEVLKEYNDKTNEDKQVISGILEKSGIIVTPKGKRIYKAIFKGENGYIGGIWLNFKQNYPSSFLENGRHYNLYGNILNYDGLLSIIHPEFIKDKEVNSVRSIYTVPTGLYLTTYRKALKYALENGLDEVFETLPKDLLEKYNYPSIQDSIKTIHYPETEINANKIQNYTHPAYKRFIYEELLYFQLIMAIRRKSYTNIKGIEFKINKEFLNNIKDIMPFTLTKAQRKVLVEIFNDMIKPLQMNRLVQGDVGSGKTIIAFIAAAAAVKNGYQVAIIAPTEVLARQHYENMNIFFKNFNINSTLLTGSTKNKEKKIIKNLISNSEIDIVVGTHAIIEDDVEFNKLGLIIVDEQHRFGVRQRKILMNKGVNPDILLMTATPIPRSLAMTLYGDLDISIIDEMPPGRKACITKLYTFNKLDKSLEFVKEILNNDNKAYFVYPLIDESNKVEAKAAVQSYEHIKNFFNNTEVGLLHGKMKADEKKELLNKFKYGNLNILVSTTVIEVGVDVPEATVMFIENAERFGLAQLHQLRGRVGRSNRQSYCLLITSENLSENGRERMNAMLKYTDGFKLSEIDLELRGQGDFFGIKQSGIPEFKYANIIRDIVILKDAKNDMLSILNNDPEIKDKKNYIIKKYLTYLSTTNTNYFGIG